MNPLVSILIPVYNGSNFLSQAIDSALNQTYKKKEIIVINDGSNDDGKTETIALSYGNKIKYFFKKNGGVSTALNLGINNMQGEYFSWLSHDDLYYPEKIEKQINFLRINSFRKDIILYTNSEIIDENNNVLKKLISKKINPDLFRIEICKGLPLDGCSLLIPKICFNEVGMFSEKLKTTQDYTLWFEFSYKYKFININEILVKSREHKSRTGYIMNELHQKESNIMFIKFIEKIFIIDFNNHLIDEKNKFIKDTFFFLSKKKLFQASFFCIRFYELSNLFSYLSKFILYLIYFFLLGYFIFKMNLKKIVYN